MFFKWHSEYLLKSSLNLATTSACNHAITPQIRQHCHKHFSLRWWTQPRSCANKPFACYMDPTHSEFVMVYGPLKTLPRLWRDPICSVLAISNGVQRKAETLHRCVTSPSPVWGGAHPNHRKPPHLKIWANQTKGISGIDRSTPRQSSLLTLFGSALLSLCCAAANFC